MPVYIPANRGGVGSGATSISGAYTKAEADLRFVHINGNETINGVKTFTGNISANADVFISDGIPGRIVVFDLDKSLSSSLYSVNSFALSGHTHTEYVYASDVSNITGNLQSQITSNLVQQLSTDSLLQQQINTIAGGYHLVFTEQFTGNGLNKNFILSGAITNAQFISGGWNVANVLNSLDSSVTDANGKAIYDAGLLSIFTRHRIYVDSITGAGVVNLDYPPQNGQVFKVWYWYNVAQTDKIDNYYREDYVAKMEQNDGDLSTNIKVNTVYFNNILSFLDTDVQKALQTIDQNVPSFAYVNNISGSLYSLIYDISGSFVKSLNTLSGDINIVAGNNISVAVSGDDIIISSENVVTEHNNLNGIQGGGISGYYHLSAEQFTDFIGKSEVASISGNLQNQINSLQSSPGGVVSVNNITGNVSIIGTDGISVNISGSNIILSTIGGSISGNLEHNELIGLQGGNISERYHLSQQQYSETIYGLDTTFTYSNGNLSSKITSRGTQIFSYNIDGALISISGTGDYGSKTFTYDASGNLIGINVL